MHVHSALHVWLTEQSLPMEKGKQYWENMKEWRHVTSFCRMSSEGENGDEFSSQEPIDVSMMRMLRKCDRMLLDTGHTSSTDNHASDNLINQSSADSGRANTLAAYRTLSPPLSPIRLQQRDQFPLTKPPHRLTSHQQQQQSRGVRSVPNSLRSEAQVYVY